MRSASSASRWFPRAECPGNHNNAARASFLFCGFQWQCIFTARGLIDAGDVFSHAAQELEHGHHFHRLLRCGHLRDAIAELFDVQGPPEGVTLSESPNQTVQP